MWLRTCGFCVQSGVMIRAKSSSGESFNHRKTINEARFQSWQQFFVNIDNSVTGPFTTRAFTADFFFSFIHSLHKTRLSILVWKDQDKVLPWEEFCDPLSETSIRICFSKSDFRQNRSNHCFSDLAFTIISFYFAVIVLVAVQYRLSEL